MTGFDASRRRLTALRLRAQGIAAPASPEPADTVASLLALQAQDYPGALWSVAVRTPGATLASVEQTHLNGDFVRSWPMRGTLHFVKPDDLGWMLSLTGERMVRSAETRRRDLGLTAADFATAEKVARTLLAGGHHAERADLLAAFDAAGVSPAGQRGVNTLGQLAQTGVIVLSGQKRYALLDEWATHPRRLDRDAALHELALRYFTSHGPATVTDLAWWSSLTLTDARAALAAARDELDELELDGTVYHLRPGLDPAENGVHLLTGFDEYLLGYADRGAALAPEHKDVIVPGGNGMFLSTVVVNGEVAGTWRRNRTAKRVDVTVQPFATLSAGTRRGIHSALKRYGDYLELPVVWSD
ncbi:winged helix DNA-binding domain-containing protein [soil metagenome]